MMHSLHRPDGAADSALLLRLSGDVDPPDAPALERCVRAALHAPAVHLDLADLGFVGTFFASWLLETARRLEDAGVLLSLRAPNRRLTRLLVRLDLADRFDLLADAPSPTPPSPTRASGDPTAVRPARDASTLGRLPSARYPRRVDVVETRRGDVVVLAPGAEVDVRAVPAFEARVARLVAGGSRAIVFDLGGVELLPSTIAGFLVVAAGRVRAAGGRFALAVPSPRVRAVLSTLGLDAALAVRPTLDAACAAVAAPAGA
jgi:anti-anti-sigma factor